MASSASLIDDITPYSIRISSRHLNLTGTKLSLARLPHEQTLRPSSPSTSSSATETRLYHEEWARGIPKRELEPLLDHWIEEYDFESVQQRLNDTLPQFRVSLRVPGASGEKVRVHYVHMMEEDYEPGVPLLYIPSWPAGFSELEPLVPYLFPDEQRGRIPFSVVCPSWPGIGGGFSDLLPSQMTSSRAYFTLLATLWDTLMIRLGYDSYIACGGGEWAFPVLEALSQDSQSGCRGVHFSKVVLQAPKFRDHPSIWLQWKSASLLSVFRPESETLGYSPVDLAAPPKTEAVLPSVGVLEQPQTLSYALTDSPVGMLALVRAYLQRYAPQFSTTRFLIEGGREKTQFFLSRSEIVTLALLAWLPGSEGVLNLAKLVGNEQEQAKKKLQKKKGRPLIGVSDYDHTLGAPIEWAAMLGEIVFRRRHTAREVLRHTRRFDVHEKDDMDREPDETKGFEERKEVTSPPSRPPLSPLAVPTLPTMHTGSSSTLSLDSKGRMPPINEEPEPEPAPRHSLPANPRQSRPDIEPIARSSHSPLASPSSAGSFTIKRKPLPPDSPVLASSSLPLDSLQALSPLSSASAPNLAATLVQYPSASMESSTSSTLGLSAVSERPRSHSYSFSQPQFSYPFPSTPSQAAVPPSFSSPQVQLHSRSEIPPAHRSSYISADMDELSLTCSSLSTSSSQERRDQRDSMAEMKESKPSSKDKKKAKKDQKKNGRPSLTTSISEKGSERDREKEKKLPRNSYPAFAFPALYVKDLRSFARIVCEKGVLDATYGDPIIRKREVRYSSTQKTQRRSGGGNGPQSRSQSQRGVGEIEQLRQIIVGPS